jgi:TDG/mug DNA glycosylase family protein
MRQEKRKVRRRKEAQETPPLDVEPWKPTRAQIAAALNATVPDIIAPDLHVLFVGINPGLYSGAVGHHFARPGNRFWPALFAGGFTDRLLSPFEETRLLEVGCGITNLVDRATATADQLGDDELIAGARHLTRKIRRYQPRIAAIVGVTAYRVAFERPKAVFGQQEESIGETNLWVLPNPSGLNAHFQAKELGRLFGALRAGANGER